MRSHSLRAVVVGANRRDKSHIDGSSGEEDPNLFDRVAARYDLLNSLMSAGLHHRWRERAADKAALGPGETAGYELRLAVSVASAR